MLQLKSLEIIILQWAFHAAENITVSNRNIAIGKDARNDVGAGGTDNIFLGTYSGGTTADLENGIGIGRDLLIDKSKEIVILRLVKKQCMVHSKEKVLIILH